MPAHLVERITASLAAEQAQRSERTSTASVTPLIGTPRRRPGRLVFALAGVAAAVALVAVLSSSLFTLTQPATTAGSAALDRSSSAESGGAAFSSKPPEPGLGAGPSADGKAAARAAAPPLVQIRESGTRYTRTSFVAQAQALRSSTFDLRQSAPKPSGLGATGTTSKLIECLGGIDAAQAQEVRVDFALYEGRPAVIMVATKGGIPVAFAVGPQCSPAGPTVLHAATPLP